MKLIFQQKTIQMGSTDSVDEIISEINGLLDKGYYFSHFIADGVEVFERHEDYLEQHKGQLEKLEVVSKTVKEFINDLLLEAEDYIKKATPELIKLAEEFYDNPVLESWGKLEQLLGGLQWLDEMLLIIGKSEVVPSNWSSYLSVSSKMQEEIRNLAEALENEDNVLIGDILQYELIPNFEGFESVIKATIDNEGKRHDLN